MLDRNINMGERWAILKKKPVFPRTCSNDRIRLHTSHSSSSALNNKEQPSQHRIIENLKRNSARIYNNARD